MSLVEAFLGLCSRIQFNKSDYPNQNTKHPLDLPSPFGYSAHCFRRYHDNPRSNYATCIARRTHSLGEPASGTTFWVENEKVMQKIPLIALVVVSLALVFSLSAGAGPLDSPGAQKSLVCSACHGFGGNSPGNHVPILAAMNTDYFKKAIKDYAEGKRPSP